MTTLTCPRCGEPVERHSDDYVIGPCGWNTAQATRVAQRRKAAEGLKQHYELPCENPVLCKVFKSGYLKALRDTGILGEGESEAELLKELEGEAK